MLEIRQIEADAQWFNNIARPASTGRASMCVSVVCRWATLET